MNIYSLIPLVAALAYIPSLVTTLNTRPQRSQHRLFIVFLTSSILWGLADYLFRSNLFPQLNFLLFKIVILSFVWMTVQFHCFSSSFFPAEKGRWLLWAYAYLALNILVVALGYLPEDIVVVGESLFPQYGIPIVFVALPLMILLIRNFYVFSPLLKHEENPITHNQAISLVIALLIFTVFASTALLPFGRQFPVLHLGNLISASILSYAVMGQQVIDIRSVLRTGLIRMSIGAVSIAGYLALLLFFHALFKMELTPGLILASSLAGVLTLILVYELRGFFAKIMGKAFQGESYYYRHKLIDFANNIHNVFSLEEQGDELLIRLIRAVGCRKAGLLFLDADSEDFFLQQVQSIDKNNSLSPLKLGKDNPIVERLKQARIPLTRASLFIQPEFMSIWQREKEIVETNEIELFIPLISRERLIGILVLDKKKTGRYTLEDYALLEEVTGRVAVSIEKEYLREQLKQREEELSIINRSSAIITSSLDIQKIYDKVISELKRMVKVDWAAIAIIEGSEVYFMAIASEVGSPWQVGERIPLKGSATEWVAGHRSAIVDHDLSLAMRFSSSKYHLQHGIRSLVYQPLIVSNQVIGTLIVASREPDTYNQRHLRLLQQFASQISMPIENARL